MISVIGGKLTTAASLARECARKIGIQVVDEDELLLPVAAPPEDGVTSTFAQWSRQVAASTGISAASARAIAEWHGRYSLCVAQRAARDAGMGQRLCDHSDHLVAEAVSAMEHEFATSLSDVLLRRVPVALAACWSPLCSRIAAARVGAALGWSEARIVFEYEAFEQERNAFLINPAAATATLSRSQTAAVRRD
jgi:glycerol-3-phosphate dehydrogenase